MYNNANYHFNRFNKNRRRVNLSSRHNTKPQHTRKNINRQTYTFHAKIEGIADQPKVELFKLERNDNDAVLEWRTKVTNAYTICAWSEETAMSTLKILVNEEVYAEAVSDKRITFKTAVERIVKAYITPSYVEILKQRLYRVQYDKARNVRDYAEYIKDLSKTINIATNEKYSDSLIYDFFKIGLPQHLRDMLFSNQITSMSSAIEIISNYESSQDRRKQRPDDHSNQRRFRDHQWKRPDNRDGSNNGTRTYDRTPRDHRTKKINKVEREPESSSETINKKFIYPCTYSNLSSKPKSSKTLSIDLHKPVCPYLEISINNTTVVALIDTGSPITIIKPKYLTEKDILNKTTTHITGVNNTRVKVKGKAQISIKNGEVENKIDCYVTDDINEEVILGIDYLHASKIQLKFGDYQDKDAFVQIEEKLSDKININSLEQAIDPVEEISKAVEEAKKVNPDLGLAQGSLFTIELTDQTPIQVQKPYKIPEALMDSTIQKLNKMIDKGIIRKSTGYFASPAFVKPKKNGDVNILVDYRKLNKVTKVIPYPFPDIKSKFRGLKNAMVFSTLDLNSGYYQVPIREQDKKYTAFITEFGVYEYNRVPFGLVNPPKFFTRMMEELFADIEYVKIFIDDILVFSSNLTEHREHLELVFRRIRSKGLSIYFEKSVFCKTSVKYLGCVIGQGTVSPDKSELEKLANYINVKTKKDLQKLLGYLNWNRQFAKGMSVKLATITDKLSHKNNMTWTDSDKEIIMQLKEEIKQTKLYFPDFTLDFQLYTDASDRGCSGILTQNDKLIMLYSYKFNPAEARYNIVEKELLAIFKSMEEFKNITFGHKVLIYTDNRNLTFLKETDKSRIARWKIALSEYDIEYVHIAGCKNTGADYLSRVINDDETEKEIVAANIAEDDRIIVREESKINKIVKYYHSLLTHPGINKTCAFIRKLYKIEKLEEYVTTHINSCTDCIKNKKTNHKFGETTGDLVFRSPFQAVAIDLYGPVKWDNETWYSLSIVDMCTRWCEFVPLADISAESTWNALYTQWIRRYPLPERILADNGKQFTAQSLRDNLAAIGVKLVNICKYNPQSNAICERLHSSLGNCLRINRSKSFSLALADAADSHRSTIHSTLGVSPMKLVMGYEKVQKGTDIEPSSELTSAIQKMEQKAEKNRSAHNKRTIPVRYYRGDYVFVKKAARSNKMDNIYDGPYLVTAVYNNSVEVMKKHNILDRVNLKRIIPCGERQAVTE